MAEVKKLDISKMEKYKLTYIYFFPVVFLPLTSIYLIKTGEEPKSFFLTNVLIGLSVVLIPFIIAVCMFAAKVLHKDQNRHQEVASIGLGLLCFFFLIACNYYQYYKFASQTIELANFNLAISTALLLSSFVSSIAFAMKYINYSKNYPTDTNAKMKIFMVSALFPLLMAICTHLVF